MMRSAKKRMNTSNSIVADAVTIARLAAAGVCSFTYRVKSETKKCPHATAAHRSAAAEKSAASIGKVPILINVPMAISANSRKTRSNPHKCSLFFPVRVKLTIKTARSQSTTHTKKIYIICVLFPMFSSYAFNKVRS